MTDKDIAEMLRSVAERLEKGVDAGVIRSNGKVGTDRKFYNHRGFLTHQIILSNGRALLIEEDKDSLHIAEGSEVMEGEPEMYICEINASGVLVMPNSGGAVDFVTSGLQKNLQDIDGVTA